MPLRDLGVLMLAPQHLKALQALLHTHVPKADVWAYGSRVTDKAHEGSDLDLVLRNPVDLQQEVEGWYELQEALQESTLPMLVEVHQWTQLPTSFHPQIEAAYAVLQDSSRRAG